MARSMKEYEKEGEKKGDKDRLVLDCTLIQISRAQNCIRFRA